MSHSTKKLTIESFIEKAKLVHGDKYDYSKVVYSNNKTKVIIVCKIHGEFIQSPIGHLTGNGCQICGKSLKDTDKTFIEKAIKVHGDKYDYSKVNYIKSQQKIIIACKLHGDFLQKPNDHLNGYGCSKCARELNAKTVIAKGKLTFFSTVDKIHSDKYDYSNSLYTGMNNKILITCPTHGDFFQTPASHLNGRGCPNCAEYGFNPNKPAILYYLKITTTDNQVLYKIGITNKTVNERFRAVDLSKIEILKQKLYEKGSYAKEVEKRILRKFYKFKYTGPKILLGHGNTELFTIDIR